MGVFLGYVRCLHALVLSSAGSGAPLPLTLRSYFAALITDPTVLRRIALALSGAAASAMQPTASVASASGEEGTAPDAAHDSAQVCTEELEPDSGLEHPQSSERQRVASDALALASVVWTTAGAEAGRTLADALAAYVLSSQKIVCGI